MTIREGRWLCPSCGSENLGRAEACTACGAARPQGVRFYLPGDAGAVTEAALLRDARSGADWHCSHCGGANPNSLDGQRVERCRHCGEARDETDASLPVRAFGVGEAPATTRGRTVGWVRLTPADAALRLATTVPSGHHDIPGL